MKYVLGIDIGSSATKTALFNENRNLIRKDKVAASDPKAALFGAIGTILYEENIGVEDIDAFMLTGMGASYIKKDIYGKAPVKVTEFESLGAGGLWLSGKEEAIVGSVGTGTALVYAKGDHAEHVGGSAVGGGTLVGLCSRLFGVKEVDVINEMVAKGNIRNVDWGIAELSCDDYMKTLPEFATSSNLGKMLSTATDDDVALGIMNMIFEISGTLAVFACQNKGIKDVVMVGTLSGVPQAEITLGRVGQLYGMNFEIPKDPGYATAIGAGLLYFRK